MNKTNSDFSTRRSLLTGMGLAATGMAAGVSSGANAQGASANFQAKRHPMDSWLGDMPGDHRVFIDSSRPLGGGEGMRYANNILNAHTSAYGGSESEYAIIVCFRRFSTPFGWGDAAWEKYGKVLNGVLKFPDPTTNEPFSVNPMNIAGRRDLPNGSNTIDSLGERGIIFAVCDAATRVISGVLARAVDGSAEEIYAELVESGVPNSQFIPAGVSTATRAQEYGYSYLYAGL
jgi:hypothetical protein